MGASTRSAARPRSRAEMRAAFVGDAETTRLFGLSGPTAGIHAACFAPSDKDALAAFGADVVVAFGEPAAAAAAAAGRSAPVLAVLADEQRPVPEADCTACWSPSPQGGAWRLMVPPVADAVFRALDVPCDLRTVLIGGDDVLAENPALASVATTFSFTPATGAPPPADVAVYLAHADSAAERLPLAFAHLAAGHLLLSQRIDPGFGLVPGTDYVEIGGVDDLDLRLHQLRRHPATYDRVRVQGHLKARRLRGSLVWPRVLGDLLRDVASLRSDGAGHAG